jgi:ABC-type nitrate/sulfonate/bicarbonate transport system substrate-binding protein
MSAKLRCLGAVAACVAVVTCVAPAAALDKINVGKSVATSFTFAPLEIGNEFGIWKQENLELNILAFRGDAQMQQALTAGTIDFGLGSGPGMGFMAKGVPAKGVAAFASVPQNMALIVSPAGKIKSVDDLKGAKIGVTTAGSLTYWLVKEMSRQQGWTGADAMTPLPMGTARARLAAMKNGEINGSVQSIEVAAEWDISGDGRTLLLFGDIVKHFHTHIMFATDKMIADKPDVVRRYLRGWFRTVDRMRKERDTAIRIGAKVVEIQPEALARTFDPIMAMMSSDGRFDPQAIEVISRSLVELGILDKVPAREVMFTEKFVPVKF